MKFALLIQWDENQPTWTDADEERAVLKHRDFHRELGARFLAGERLRPEREATRVSVRGGVRKLVDGPFTETKEVLGGFYLIECATRDEALELATRCPASEYGTVELREIG